jgi:hypothetical protein
VTLYAFAPRATRLAVLATTVGIAYAIADLFAPLVARIVRRFTLDADPTRIPQRSNESGRKVKPTTSRRKAIAMSPKIIFATAATLLLTTTTSLADDGIKKEMPPISNALEIAIGGGYMRGAGDVGHNMAAVDDLTEGGGGAELHVGYRITPELVVGAYGTLSGYEVGDAVATTTDLAIGATAGVEGVYHFRPSMQVDPWVSVGAGWKALWLGNDDGTERALQGIELTRVQIGVDYRLTPTFALAPFMGASAAMFLAEDTMTSSGYQQIDHTEVNWSVSAGLMGRFDILTR